ncbi:hypothetical protein AWJ20_3709 [Sugiyamaella lignohabitans]|uniref:Uncharacterized protein n=1 Tax=Sugiyamaella lignohabitans TaxID=796027 RepID=A0A167BWG6_9ASCO|nr:uncharacterized protein AWJ20_3709 [Sugiyamaella lignohabitans]ANB10915.1 hypothetical protein AWJ20_3709 [Sugiyamaella lignohabitans]
MNTDKTGGSTVYGPDHPDSQHYEDSDSAMATAIQQSIDSSNNNFKAVEGNYYQKYGEQESGELQKFGPATRESYDSKQWGIVPYSEASSSTSTVAAGLQQAQGSTTPIIYEFRNGIPIVLPADDAIYIAPLMMIIHSIPLGRKALLNGGVDLVPDYGFDPLWWLGEKLIDLQDGPIHNRERLMIEIQRYTAFLDGESRRPCALIAGVISEAGPRASKLILKSNSQDEKPIGRFLQDLVKFWGPDSEFANVFQSTAMQERPSSFEEEDGEVIQKFTNLVTDVTVALQQSIYDFIDDLMSADGGAPTTFIKDISDIVNITIKRDDGNSGTGIEIPAIWYPDRYSEEYFECVNLLHRRRTEFRKQLTDLNARRLEISSTKGKDISKLLNISYDYIKEISEKASDEDKENFSLVEKELADVKNLYKHRKESIVEQVTQTQQIMLREANLFKGLLSDEDKKYLAEIYPAAQSLPAMRPYRLRGLIISPTEFCFLRSQPADDDVDLVDLGNDGDSEKSFRDPTWTKIVWGDLSENGSSELYVGQITQQDAINWAKQGSSGYKWQEVVAFYANDYATNVEAHKVALSEGLRKFIQADKQCLEDQVANVKEDEEIKVEHEEKSR